MDEPTGRGELGYLNRRQLLKAAGMGLAVPAASSLLTACANPFNRDGDEPNRVEGRLAEAPHSVGSDSTMHGSGDASPVPHQVKPFAVFDPFLPPVEAGPKELEVVAIDETVYIAQDVPYAGWTFGGTIPGPVFRLVEGDTVNVTFRVDQNASTLHSLDLHAAKTPPEVNYRSIAPGEEFQWSFVAPYPGAYMYHCGTPPVLMHIGAGMYGALIVDPKEGWPPAQELVFVQSEFYLNEAENGIMVPAMDKMMGHGDMDYVAFNGYANQYAENPIRVRAGELIRIFLVNAGPNIWSSFHVVGGIFDAAYINANPQNKQVGLQSISVGPGDGACVEFVLDESGVYTAVNHSFGHASHGAVGLLQAE